VYSDSGVVIELIGEIDLTLCSRLSGDSGIIAAQLNVGSLFITGNKTQWEQM
jgi:hypothetical protein